MGKSIGFAFGFETVQRTLLQFQEGAGLGFVKVEDTVATSHLRETAWEQMGGRALAIPIYASCTDPRERIQSTQLTSTGALIHAEQPITVSTRSAEAPDASQACQDELFPP